MPWGHGCGPELLGSRSSSRDFPFLCSTCLLPQTQSYTFMTAFNHSFSKCLLGLLWARHLFCALSWRSQVSKHRKWFLLPWSQQSNGGDRPSGGPPGARGITQHGEHRGKQTQSSRPLARVGTSQGIPGEGGTPSHPELLFCKFPTVHGEQAIHGTCCVAL